MLIIFFHLNFTLVKSDVIAGNYAKAAAFNRTINWEHYENNISKSGFVADFKVSKITTINLWIVICHLQIKTLW